MPPLPTAHLTHRRKKANALARRIAAAKETEAAVPRQSTNRARLAALIEAGEILPGQATDPSWPRHLERLADGARTRRRATAGLDLIDRRS